MLIVCDTLFGWCVHVSWSPSLEEVYVIPLPEMVTDCDGSRARMCSESTQTGRNMVNVLTSMMLAAIFGHEWLQFQTDSKTQGTLPSYQQNITHKVRKKSLHSGPGYNVLGAYEGAKGPLMG